MPTILRYILTLSFYSLFYLTPCRAQNGTMVYDMYTVNTYWNDQINPAPTQGAVYTYPLIDTSLDQLNNLFDRYFKFNPEHFYNHASDSIRILETFTNHDSLNSTFNHYYNINPNSGYRQLNPNKYYTFSIDGILDTAFAAKILKTGPQASADTEICFFIIPGSGHNQTTDIIRGIGYHNNNCGIVNNLKKHGDVFVFVKPNEDYRAFRISPLPVKKSVTDKYPTDSYMNLYLNSHNRPEGINYLLECVAALKELKKKYKKVFLLGVSQGGYSAFYSALEAEVDGAMISSGYTIKLDTNPGLYGNMPAKFGLLKDYYSKDSVKRKIRSQKTDYFFTYAINDNYAYEQENANHFTQNYFNENPALLNTAFYYDFSNHSFPPCPIVDSFVNQVKRKPKAFLSDTLNSCMHDSILMHLEFIGRKPFQYDIYRNDTLLETVTHAGNLDTLYFYQNGYYQIKNVVDSNGIAGIWSDKIKIQKPAKPDLKIVSRQFLCDSNKTRISYTCQGQKPFAIAIYKKDSLGNQQPYSQIMNADTLNEIIVENGEYFFELTDYYQCLIPKDSVSIQEKMISYQMVDVSYHCGYSETKFEFNLEGKTPYSFNYIKDTVSITTLFNSDNPLVYLPNGEYLFTTITDSNNCVFQINETYSIHLENIDWDITNIQYNCDSNKTGVELQLQGNAPWTAYYTRNSMPLQFSSSDSSHYHLFDNAFYTFDSLADSTGCMLVIGDTQQFNFDTLSIQMSNPVYDCDSNKTKIEFTMQGNPPFYLHYFKNGLSQQHTFFNYSGTLFLDNGSYLFEKMSDSTNCEYHLNQNYNFNFNQVNAIITQQKFNCDSNKYEVILQLSGNSPWQVHYHNSLNTYLLLTHQNINNLFLENENWHIGNIIDSTGCSFNINTPIAVNYQALVTTVTGPVFDCDSDKVKLHFNLQGNFPINIHYTQMGNPFVTQTYAPTLDEFFANGTYTLQKIEDSTQCSEVYNQNFSNNFQTFSSQKLQPGFNCDSAKLIVRYAATGDSPYTIHYTDLISGTPYTFQANSDTIQFLLTNGLYAINSINDIKCSIPLQDTITANYQKLESTVSQMNISCDSAKFFIEYNTVGGNKPFVYEYAYNNVYDSIFTELLQTRQYLNNGSYLINKVMDSTGCVISYNRQLYPQYIPFSYQGFETEYNCDKDSTSIRLNTIQSNRVIATYKLNNQLIDTMLISPGYIKYFANGTYLLEKITDSLGCSTTYNQIIEINNEPVGYTLNRVTNCETKDYTYKIDLLGKSPWTLQYQQEGIPQEFEMGLKQNNQLLLQAGKYHFVSIEDANDCLITLDKYDTLFSYLDQAPVLKFENGRIHTSPTPFTNYWYKNNLLYDSTIQYSRLASGSGTYTVKLFDSAGCVYESNNLEIGFKSPFTIFPNPAVNEIQIMVDGYFGSYWDYSIFSADGREWKKSSCKVNSTILNIRDLPKGSYTIIIKMDIKASGKAGILRFIKI